MTFAVNLRSSKVIERKLMMFIISHYWSSVFLKLRVLDIVKSGFRMISFQCLSAAVDSWVPQKLVMSVMCLPHCCLVDMFWTVWRRHNFLFSLLLPFPVWDVSVVSLAFSFQALPSATLSLQGLNLCLLSIVDQFEPVFREALFVSHEMLR